MREESIETVVVIFPGALGDLLLALPALRALRMRHDGAHATAVVNAALREIASLAGVADQTVALEGADTAALFADEGTPRWLEGRPHVYSWLGADDAGVRTRVAATARTAHFFRVERGPGTTHAAVACARAVHASANTQTVAGASVVSPPRSAAADALLADIAGPVLAIHPGAGSRSKRWDIAGFVQVAHWWRAGGGTVLAVAGPAEAGEPAALGAPEVREWPLPDLAAVLSRAALYLGNDSGISHLAGAVGTAGAVLYGPTDPRRWGPLSKRVVALRARSTGPEGIPLSALPAARVIAACRRRFALTRGDPDTSVGSFRLTGRS